MYVSRELSGEQRHGTSSHRTSKLHSWFLYAVTRDIFVDVGVGIGITQDAPDVQATIAVPIRIPRLFSEPAR
jgi:hypothetical protein